MNENQLPFEVSESTPTQLIFFAHYIEGPNNLFHDVIATYKQDCGIIKQFGCSCVSNNAMQHTSTHCLPTHPYAKIILYLTSNKQ